MSKTPRPPGYGNRVERLFSEVRAELVAQLQKWGYQTHPSFRGNPGEGHPDEWLKRLDHWRAGCSRPDTISWLSIFMEEVCEAAVERGSPARLRAELVQVVAVGMAWLERLDAEHRAPEADVDHVYEAARPGDDPALLEWWAPACGASDDR